MAESTRRDRWSLAVALSAHIALAAGLPRGSPAAPRAALPIQLIDFEPVPLAAAPKTIDPAPVAAAARTPPVPRARTRAGPRASPPAAAGPALTPASPLPAGDAAPLDFTLGSRTTYGTDSHVARAAATAMPRVAGHGSAVVDRSRGAALAGGLEWRCPFPSEADRDAIDSAVAVLNVVVSAQGTPEAVQLLRDPGHGFGRAARECALARSYVPALDRDGRPIAASVPVSVRFVR